MGEENAALHIDGITQCVHEIKGDVQESAIAQQGWNIRKLAYEGSENLMMFHIVEL